MSTIGKSKLTRKYQARIPKNIWGVLGLRVGDTVVYEVSGSRVLIRRELPADNMYSSAVGEIFGEWDSELDQVAYGKL